ncbi:7-methylguanosine phosphate-specific 5'-nucleotidase-like isoform X2 [Tubulanus polymorphus]|uniref:7-methylguanosine phosphate-specific 5'-nucleotidase-like isoform X2 n=1 Tax=Tubulanus polymorphus TaxID=672921 RepID=UPI003DA1D08A
MINPRKSLKKRNNSKELDEIDHQQQPSPHRNGSAIKLTSSETVDGINPSTMLELEKQGVHIRDLDYVKDILQQMIEDGKDKLQVIADFDRTLTKYSHNGQLVPTSHGIMDDSDLMPIDFKKAAADLRSEYYAIEIDSNLTVAEKCPFMIEWWTKAHDLLLKKCNIYQKDIKAIVSQSEAQLRDGVDWMFKQLHKAEVPCLIFSAGVGDVIQEVIHYRSKMFDNMKIVSNFMQFDSSGKLIDFQGEMIHIFNKNESAIHESDYFTNLSHRDNVILLGDSVGDIRMAEGANSKNLLKIGYLNNNVSENLGKYMQLYDIVLENDETFDLCNSLLRQILQTS